jgi:ADP-ribosyltransferase exoenzyme
MLKDKVNWLVESWSSKEYVEHTTGHKASEPSEGLTDWHHKVLAEPKHGHIMNDAIERQHELTPHDANHVADYQIDSARLNHPIRGNLELSPKREAQKKSLDKVTHSPLKHDTVAYRGLAKDFKHLPIGSEFKDKGFTGTSISKSEAKLFADRDYDTHEKVMARVFLKKGHHGAYLPHSKPGVSKHLQEQVGDMDGEHELLLPRNTKFKVIGHSKEPARPGELLDTHYVNLEAHHEHEDDK